MWKFSRRSVLDYTIDSHRFIFFFIIGNLHYFALPHGFRSPMFSLSFQPCANSSFIFALIFSLARHEDGCKFLCWNDICKGPGSGSGRITFTCTSSSLRNALLPAVFCWESKICREHVPAYIGTHASPHVFHHCCLRKNRPLLPNEHGRFHRIVEPRGNRRLLRHSRNAMCTPRDVSGRNESSFEPFFFSSNTRNSSRSRFSESRLLTARRYKYFCNALD